MFDRNDRVEGPVSAEITLASGRQLSGKFILPAGRTLVEALNGPSTFIEFEPQGDERTFIAKSALQSVTPLKLAPRQTTGTEIAASSTAQ